MRRIKSKVVTYLVEKVVGEGYTGVIKQNTVGTEGYIAGVVVEDVTVGGASFSGQYVQLTSPSIHSQWLTPLENGREIFFNISLISSSDLTLTLSSPNTTLYYDIRQAGVSLYSGSLIEFGDFAFSLTSAGTSIDFSIKFTLVTFYNAARCLIRVK